MFKYLVMASMVLGFSMAQAKDEKKTERNPSSSAPRAVTDAAAKIKSADVKTVITQVTNTDDNPCMPSGVSYNVELKVKKAFWNGIKSKVEYNWETVKQVNVSDKGEVMEVCAE